MSQSFKIYTFFPSTLTKNGKKHTLLVSTDLLIVFLTLYVLTTLTASVMTIFLENDVTTTKLISLLLF